MGEGLSSTSGVMGGDSEGNVVCIGSESMTEERGEGLVLITGLELVKRPEFIMVHYHICMYIYGLAPSDGIFVFQM